MFRKRKSCLGEKKKRHCLKSVQWMDSLWWYGTIITSVHWKYFSTASYSIYEEILENPLLYGGIKEEKATSLLPSVRLWQNSYLFSIVSWLFQMLRVILPHFRLCLTSRAKFRWTTMTECGLSSLAITVRAATFTDAPDLNIPLLFSVMFTVFVIWT